MQNEFCPPGIQLIHQSSLPLKGRIIKKKKMFLNQIGTLKGEAPTALRQRGGEMKKYPVRGKGHLERKAKCHI